MSVRRIAILVTGSRDHRGADAIRDALQALADELDPMGSTSLDSDVEFTLIHGDCGKRNKLGVAYEGADLLADDVAAEWEWTRLPMPAPWKQLGKHAGPERNEAMVTVLLQLRYCGYECHVLAFPLPGSKGTHDCIRKARAAGFDVTVVPSTQETP